MANEDFLLDAEDDVRAVEYIRCHLSQELQEKFTDDLLYYFLDVLAEYYYESRLWDEAASADDYVEIDLEEVAAHLAKRAEKEGMGKFNVEDLLFIVQYQLDFEEEEMGEE